MKVQLFSHLFEQTLSAFIRCPGSKRIYIFGGFDGNKWLNDLHVLDVGRLEVRESSIGKFHENDL